MALNDVQPTSQTTDHADHGGRADHGRHGHRSGADKPSGRSGVLTGAAVVVACMVACSLPLVAAGGALAGVGAFLAGGKAVALGVVMVVAAIVVGGVKLRRRNAAARGDSCSTGCGCGGDRS
jgi:hypothetical protein